MEKKKFIQALPEIEPEPEIRIKPTKVERKEKYEKKKKAVKELKTEIKPRELNKNDRKIYKQALNQGKLCEMRLAPSDDFAFCSRAG